MDEDEDVLRSDERRSHPGIDLALHLSTEAAQISIERGNKVLQDVVDTQSLDRSADTGPPNSCDSRRG